MRADSQITGRLCRALCLAALWLPAPASAAEPAGWAADGKHHGVALDFRPGPAGFRAYRGTVEVCTDLPGLQDFVGDAEGLPEWIPNTEEARALPGYGPRMRYYLRTSAPWPFKSRDMVYELTLQDASADGTIRIDLQGLPDALPEQPDAVRMEGAEGHWILEPRNGRIRVTLSLALNPGRVPAFFANRRIAATTGGMLANLEEQFSCDQP